MVEFKIDKTKSDNWRGGTPINPNSPKTLAILRMQETIRLEQVITHPQFFLLQNILHEADLNNIANLKNPETPFLIKSLNNLSKLTLSTKTLPNGFMEELDKSVANLLETVYQLKTRSKEQ